MILNQNKDKKDDVINSGAVPGAGKDQSSVIDTINKINFNNADELKAILSDSEGAIVKNKDLLTQLSKKKNAEAEKKFSEKIQTIELNKLDDNCLKSILQSWGRYLSDKQLEYLVGCEDQKELLQSLDGYKLIDLVQSDGFKQFCLLETATGEKKKAILSLINFDDWNRCNYIHYLLRNNKASEIQKSKAKIDKGIKQFTLFVGEHIENLSDEQVSSLIPSLFDNETINKALGSHAENNGDKNSSDNKVDDKNKQVEKVIEDKGDSELENELQNAREKINKRIDKLKENKLYQNLFELRNIKYDMASEIFEKLSTLDKTGQSELIRHLLLNPRLYWSHVRTILNCLETDEKDDENKKQVKQLIVDTLLSKKNEDMQDSDLIVNDVILLESANPKGVINLIDYCGDKLPKERVDARIKKIKLENCDVLSLEELLSKHWDKISGDQYNVLISKFNEKYAESQKQKQDCSALVRVFDHIIVVSNFFIEQISRLTNENKNGNKDQITLLKKVGDGFFVELKNIDVDGLRVCWKKIQRIKLEKVNVLREATKAQNYLKKEEDFKKTLSSDTLKQYYEKEISKTVEERKAKIEKWESQKDKVLKAIETNNDDINKFILYNLTQEGRKEFSPSDKNPKPYFTDEQIKVLWQSVRLFDKDTGVEVVPNFILTFLDLDLVQFPDLLFDSDCLFESLPDGSKPVLEKFVVGDKNWANCDSKIGKVFNSLSAKSLESLDLKFGYENNKNYTSQKPTADYSSFCKTGLCDLFYSKLEIIHGPLNENGSIMLDGLNQLYGDGMVLLDFCLGSWIIENEDFCKEHSEELEQIIKVRFDFGCNIKAFRDNEPNQRLVFTDKQKNAVVAYIFLRYRTKDSIDLQKNLAMLLEKTGDPQNVKFNLNDIGKVAKFISKINNKNSIVKKDILQCLLNNISDSAKEEGKWLFKAYVKYYNAYSLKTADKADDDIFPKEQKQEIIELMKSGVITVSDMDDDDNVYRPASKRLIKDASDEDRAKIFLKQVQMIKQSNKNETVDSNNEDLKKLIELFGKSELKLTQNQLVELLCNVDVSCPFGGFGGTAFGKCFPYYYNDSKKNNSKKDDGLRISCSCENAVTKNDNNRLTTVNYVRIVSNEDIREKYANIVDFRGCDWADKKDAPSDNQYWECSNRYDCDDEELNLYEKQRRDHLDSFSWAVNNIQIDSLKENTLLDCCNNLRLAEISENSWDPFSYHNLKIHLQKFEKDDIKSLSADKNSQYLMKFLWNVCALCHLSFDFDNENNKTERIVNVGKEFFGTDLHQNFKTAFSGEPWSDDDFLIKRVFIRKLIWMLKDPNDSKKLNWEIFMAVCTACKNVTMECGYLSLDEAEKNSSEEQLRTNLDLIMDYVNQHFIDLFVNGNSNFETASNWETITDIIGDNCNVISKSFGEQDFSNLRNQYLDSLCKKLNESIKTLENDEKLNIEENDFIQNLDRMVRYAETRYFKKDNEEIQDNKEFLALKEYVNKLKQDLELKQKNDNQEENKKLQDSQEEINQNKNEKKKEQEKENQEFENNQQPIAPEEKVISQENNLKKEKKVEGDNNNKENDSSDEKINKEKNQVENENEGNDESGNSKNKEQNNYEQEEIEDEKGQKEQKEKEKKEKMIGILNKFNVQNNKYVLKKAIEQWNKVNKQEKEQEWKDLKAKNDNQINKLNEKNIQNNFDNNVKKFDSKNKIESNNLDRGNNDELQNNNLKNTDIDVNQIISSSTSFADFCSKLADPNNNIDLNTLNFDAAKLCFWNCFRAFFSVLFFRPKVNCSFWRLVYLTVVYQNIKSKGSSYCFEAPKESNNPSQNPNFGGKQYEKNIMWFSSVLNEAKKQTEQANINPDLDTNNKNQNRIKE